VPAVPDVLAVTAFDQLAPAQAAALLLPCCASRRWAAEVVRGRPYGTLARLSAASDECISALDWADIGQALQAHPRIVSRLAGAGREASWSAQEQRSAVTASTPEHDRLREANEAYERRFGHVFLICASGRSAEQVLASLRERLDNDPAAEREVVRAELRDIARLRLAKAFR